MSNLIRFLTFLLALALTLGVLYWAYGKSNNTGDYQRTFEKKYVYGDTPREPDDHYHGSRESEIKKYRGNRYSTY